MKKISKYFLNLTLFVISIGLIISILYGVRELKKFFDPATQVVNLNTEDENSENLSDDMDKENTDKENMEMITEENEKNQELQETDSKVEKVDESEEGSETVEIEIAFTGDVLFPDYLLKAYD